MEKPVRFSENDSSFIDICRTVFLDIELIYVFVNKNCKDRASPGIDSGACGSINSRNNALGIPQGDSRPTNK